uniref:Uncharacterized LOC103024880 n=1 Tax=Astyanax mexicanus TaxID=7994 RepID=W5L863_ASTMX
MDNCARFRDEKYKNWLKAAESLYILRNSIRDFVENETETLHKTLRKKLNSDICNEQCDYKRCQSPLCDTCKRWKSEILETHTGKGKGVYWINCRPYLWPKEKWEVAKVYMPRGHTDHCSFEQFDISAILNFMGSCTHFEPFVQSKDLNKVTNMRNIVMHSPEFRLDEEKMKNVVENVLSLATLLNSHVPGDLYKTVLEAIEKVNMGILAVQEELQGMRNFLEQNKDLLENLKPQVERLNEIQEKVDEHEVKIVHLSGRVDDLEKATTTDSMFTIETLQYKNHLIEQTRKRKWPDPVFTEEIEPSGYRGRVEVNGHTFIGFQVCKKKVMAHQEVAKIALDSLRSEFESTVEPLSSATTTSSTVVLIQIMLITLVANSSHLDYCSVLAHLNKCGVKPPQELLLQKGDQFFCELQLKESFTFNDEDGSSTKKKTEQQAASIALQRLSTFLNSSSLAVRNENYKGFLKERLDALGMDSTKTVYTIDEEKATEDPEGPGTSIDASQSEFDFYICSMLFYGTVIVVLEKEISSDSFLTKEEAIESAYKKFTCVFGLNYPNGGIFPCYAIVIFGFSNKKKAEQQAAKLALQQLSPFLTCSPLAAQNENYKGFLKERLEACGIDSTKTEIMQVHMNSLCMLSNKRLRRSFFNNSVSCDLCMCVYICSRFTEIHSLLTVHHLKPPSVIVERFTTDQNVSLTLNIALDKFTFKNLSEYTSKKEATRKTYCLLGFALGIFPKDTDENKATMLVKQDFSKKTLALPKEIVDGEKTSFWCSIGEITYTLTYEGQGSTEDEAKQDTLNKALLTLPSLFGFPHLPKSSSTGETEDQINSLLRKAGQKDLTFSDERNQHKVSVTLAFSDYTMTSKMQRTKKENRNLLSNVLWMTKWGLQQPVFTDTEEALGCKAVFSVQLSCSHPDWEDKLEAAKMKLVQELHRRFRNLVDSGKQD